MKQIKALCVYCGASSNVDEVYKNAAEKLGKVLADNNISLVFGGGKLGLMGIVADSVMANQGTAIGYIPVHLSEFEGAHLGLSELEIVDSMHTRKMKMSERADGFIIMPGGFGTLDEFFEILTWRQINLHDKPIIIVNVQGYWDPLIELLYNVEKRQFAKNHHLDLFTVVNDVDGILPALRESPEPTGQEFRAQYI